MSRRLKLDIPGSDWRVPPDAIDERGLEDLFGAGLAVPLRLVVDVGFGRGEFLMGLAEKQPETAFLGIEYSYKRVLKMARRLARRELRNVRLIEAPAEQLVQQRLPDASVHAFWINFPDPWPKKRHHRRRLIQPPFVQAVARCLAPGGLLHVATDHAEYAEWIDGVLGAQPQLENLYAPEPSAREEPDRAPTAYELGWRAEGRSLHFFRYQRKTAQRSRSGRAASRRATLPR